MTYLFTFESNEHGVVGFFFPPLTQDARDHLILEFADKYTHFKKA